MANDPTGTPFEEKGPTTGLSPHLMVQGGKAAVDFYKNAFDAVEVFRGEAEDGQRLMHAHLRINNASVMLHDWFPEYFGGAPAPPIGGVTLHLQVDDADAWFARAVAAGAKITHPIADQFWGDRYGVVEDPFGHTWSIGSKLPPDRMSAKPPHA